jgi:death-on-curing protein
VRYLDLEDLLHIAERTLGEVEVRDLGLLAAAAARPQASAFSEDAYPTVHDKAAALLHSLAKNHPLVDGNKRLALAGTLAFLGLNDLRLTLDNADAYDLVMAVAVGELVDVTAIAARLGPATEAWGPGHDA